MGVTSQEFIAPERGPRPLGPAIALGHRGYDLGKTAWFCESAHFMWPLYLWLRRAPASQARDPSLTAARNNTMVRDNTLLW